MFLNKTKDNISINYGELLWSSLKANLSLAIILWLSGLTVIGILVVYGVICFRGFCLGYSISSAVATLGVRSGTVFIMSTLLIQNIILIPSIFAIAISRSKII